MSIISGMVRNPHSAKWFTNGGFDSMDKLFVLSEEEFARYLTDPADRAKGHWWWREGSERCGWGNRRCVKAPHGTQTPKGCSGSLEAR